MKRPEDKTPRLQTQPIPQHDYQSALQNAVSWLGDRYLLAEPVRRLSGDRKAYFTETRSWHPATRH
jgi:hypothetical protein